ncbi:MAG: ABC transporter permease [Desulfomonilia bacterium]
MWKRIKRMFIKEFLQMFRDPRMRIVVFGVPLIQLVIIAFALTMDVTRIGTAVLDEDNTPLSREVLAAFTSSDHFEVVFSPSTPAEFESMLDRGEVRVVIVIPRGFEEDIISGRTARVQLLADGTDSNTASVVFGYAFQITQSYAQDKLLDRIMSDYGPGRTPGRIELTPRAWFNENLESKYYYVPGLIAVMLIVVSMVVASVAIVREKEIGTIEQVMVTPIRRLEFILGKTVPYLIVGYIIMTFMFIIAMIIFSIRVHGSWLQLYILTGVFLAGNLGLALLISVSAKTQQQALLTAFFIMMPVVLLSGFIFPVRNMPIVVQYATFVNPMRWYIEILRGVVMKGVGVNSLWHAVIGQCVLAAGFILLASARFKKTIS